MNSFDSEPPNKKQKVSEDNNEGEDRGYSFDEILEIFSKINDNGKLPSNPSVKLENTENFNEDNIENTENTENVHEDNIQDENDEADADIDGSDEVEDAEKMLKVNIVTEFDSLKALMTQHLRKKEFDYINLELEHDATLEKLEQYEENAEQAKKELTKKRNIIDQLKSDNDILENQLKSFVTETERLKSDNRILVAKNERLKQDLKTKKESIDKAEPILTQYLKVMKDKDDVIQQLRNERNQDSRLLKEIREKDKQIAALKNEMGKLMNENMQKDLKWEKAQVTLKASVSQIKNSEENKMELKNLNEKNSKLLSSLEEKEEVIRKLEIDLGKKSKNNSESILKMMELSQKLASKENEINNLKASAEDEKNKGNFFVMDKHNDENDALTEKLEEKEEEVKRLNDENTEIVEALNEKENEIKTLESRYQDKLKDMMKKLEIKDKDLKNKDEDAKKMKNEFKKYFDVLSLKSTKAVEFMKKQQQRPSRKPTPNPKSAANGTLFPPNTPITKKLNHLPNLDITPRMSPSGAPGPKPSPIQLSRVSSTAPPGPALPTLPDSTETSHANVSSLMASDDEDSLPMPNLMSAQTLLPTSLPNMPVLSGNLFKGVL